MAKPRRKHPGVNSIEESPQGRHLLALWELLTGQEDLSWTPIEALKNGTTVFLLAGPEGAALLLEAKERAVGEEWLHEYALYYEDEGSGTIWLAKLEAYRWDPWLHAKETGDSSIAEAPAHKRRALSRERRQAGAVTKDRLSLAIVPAHQPPAEVVGVTSDSLRQVLEKHRVTLGPGGAIVSRPRSSADREPYTGKRTWLEELPEGPDG
jgi:hypothetical protein